MAPRANSLTWLEPGDPFPDVHAAWGQDSDAPGLLAAGGELDARTLQAAYARSIFPWFSEGQPILWWSPDPRMVLQTRAFKLHRSMKKTLQAFASNVRCEIRFDSAFGDTIQACADTSRRGQPGTWILPPMVQAYTQLHHQGIAHSVETWMDGELVGGLYCVSLGKAVFGESMFSRVPDGSKIALAALVAFSLQYGMDWIDCQQNTPHLASLGAREMARTDFLERLQIGLRQPAPRWQFETLYWEQLLSATAHSP
jgi:leucyl/phenylalanyl-tRNA--protein transferase